jgi:hypothetical protein
LKIYLVDADNGETYEDYDHQTIAAFTSFRGASQNLVDEGYEPYPYRDFMTKEYNVRFCFTVIDEYGWENSSDAKIIEMELQK